MRRLKLFALISAILMLIVFVLQNTTTVQVQFLFFSFGVPETALYFVLLLVGFVIGIIVGQRFRGGTKKK